MLLRHRAPRIESRPTETREGFEHLNQNSVAVLRWLRETRIDFVLVGPVARAIRGEPGAGGAVAIVPAPYGRNLDRLVRALWSAHARLRLDGVAEDDEERPKTMPVKMTAEKLVRGQRWTLRCGSYDLDIEGRPSGVPRYQELLYEANRLELAPALSVEVAAPEDIEHYEHVRRTGVSPQILITRTAG
jgi:hypothetical protein